MLLSTGGGATAKYEPVARDENEFVEACEQQPEECNLSQICRVVVFQFVLIVLCIFLIPTHIKREYLPSPFDSTKPAALLSQELLPSSAEVLSENADFLLKGPLVTPTQVSVSISHTFKDSGIILFMHMHKAGGTMIDFLFRKKKKAGKQINGNPWVKNEIVEYWRYNRTALETYRQELVSKGVEYIALEWNFFTEYDELDLSKFRIFTNIRDPYTRFRSNYLVEKKKPRDALLWMNQTITWWRPHSHQRFQVNYNRPNYYVKIMNGFGNSPDKEVTRKHLEIAKRRLEQFDIVTILEDQDSLRILESRYGVHYTNSKKNVNTKKYKHMDEFTLSEETFRSLNQLDYEFYEHAKLVADNLKMKLS